MDKVTIDGRQFPWMRWKLFIQVPKVIHAYIHCCCEFSSSMTTFLIALSVSLSVIWVVDCVEICQLIKIYKVMRVGIDFDFCCSTPETEKQKMLACVSIAIIT